MRKYQFKKLNLMIKREISSRKYNKKLNIKKKSKKF